MSTLAGTSFPGYQVSPAQAGAGLLIVHGIAEHGARYRHVAEALAARGIACFVYDQRGHGLAPGPRAHIEDFANFARDVELAGSGIRSRNSGLPLFVWGHSMGSVIVTLAAIDGLAWTRGVIVSGCALDALPSLGGVRGTGLRWAAALLPRLRISLRVDAAKLTHVAQLQREHMSDPLMARSASLRLLYGFAQACERCSAHLPDIKLPFLAIHGGDDAVCPVAGSQRLIAALGSSDKLLVLYPGLRHEPHNEAEAARSEVFDTMTKWILQRT